MALASRGLIGAQPVGGALESFAQQNDVFFSSQHESMRDQHPQVPMIGLKLARLSPTMATDVCYPAAK